MKFSCVVILAAAIALPQWTIAAPSTAEGGSSQTRAQQGCMNQWMFNGVWRVRVTQVVFHPADSSSANSWNVTMQWNNGTKYESVMPVDTRKNDMQLALGNGDTIAATETTLGTLNQQKLDYHSFPASGQFTYTQMFASTNTLDPNNKPAKLLITFDVTGYKTGNPGGSGKFWKLKTPGYNYRIDLTCTK